MITLPTAASAATEYDDFYESTLAQPLGVGDTDIYLVNLPAAAVGFLVVDPLSTSPEIIYYTTKGTNYVRCPSAADNEGRGVGTTTPAPRDAGTKVGMYSIAEFYEGIVTGSFMRDGFLQSRHFSSSVDPNNWVGTGEVWNYVGNNGQKEFQYVTAGDKTTKYQRGMKLRLPRVTAVPSQTMLFNAVSSQYARKLSPNNINFGNNFTIECDYNPQSFKAGLQTTLVNRTSADGQQGVKFGLTGSGQIYLQYLGASTNHFWNSWQSINLKSHQTLTAAVDLTVPSVLFYADGQLIAGSMTFNSGAHTVSSTGDLYIGASSVTTPIEYADGYLAEIKIWSTTRTAAQVKATQNTPLVGNEAGLMFYCPGNGNFNDLTANGNSLTSVNGAIATSTASPYFRSVEFGILTDMSFSAGNTTMTIYTGNKHVAPAENLTGIGYSAGRAPYGFPAEKSNWRIVISIRVQMNRNFPNGTNTYYKVGVPLICPVGDWTFDFNGEFGCTSSSSVGWDVRWALMDKTGDNYAPGVITDYPTELQGRISQGWAANYDEFMSSCVPTNINVPARAEWSMFGYFGAGGGLTGGLRGIVGSTITADCAYL